jgi:hypothetical protein
LKIIKMPYPISMLNWPALKICDTRLR